MVGLSTQVELSDCAHLELQPDEQVTFVTASDCNEGGTRGVELDVVRKAWGFYATPSLNSRLVRKGLRAALVRNRLGHFFIVLIEQGKEALFEKYAADEELTHVAWMDQSETLEQIARAIAGSRG
jgi:hypothetical protein